MGSLRLIRFDQTPAILVCKGERNLGRVSNLPSGTLVRLRWVGEEELVRKTGRLPIFPAPVSSLDTLRRLRLPLQTKMAGV